jgi:hypothetical protein
VSQSQRGPGWVFVGSWLGLGRSKQGLGRVLARSLSDFGNVLTKFIYLRMRCLNSKNCLRFSKMKTIFKKLKRNFWLNEKYFRLIIILRCTKHLKLNKKKKKKQFLKIILSRNK